MNRSAFTLVELLVVIVIIALLVALLLPAVNMARETARRAQCISRQRDLAIAMMTYNNDNNGLPGYLNELGTTPIHSWAVAVFPLIGENKRYEVLMKRETVPLVSPPVLLCPSDRTGEDKRLNYVVNCGPVLSENTEGKGEIVRSLSLFRDRRSALTTINKKIKIEEIPNGASNTILLSENVNAGAWHEDWTQPDFDPDVVTISGMSTRSINAVKNLGFLWSDEKRYFPNSSATSEPRPSSKHPGTFVVAYADGSAKPLDDEIAIGTYASPGDWLKAVCPDDAKLKEL